MTPFYPAFLRLTGKPVLLVGGGKVALQKAIGLGEAGAVITVVAPKIHPEMPNVPGVARLLRRKFKPTDLGKGAKAPPRLVVAATDDEALHARIHRLCEGRGLWVNVVDRPVFCSYIVPAVVKQGAVTFAVSTGGASPALAKFLAARLGSAFGPEVKALADMLGRMRPALKTIDMDARRGLVEDALARAAEENFSPEALARMEQELLGALPRPRGESHGAS